MPDEAISLLRFLVGQEAERLHRAPLTVDDDLGRSIIDLVGGIPLTVRLAATVLVQEGPTAVRTAADRAHALDRVRSELVRGFLYQRILDHITAPDPSYTAALRAVARAGLVLRRITADLVRDVLIPSVDPAPDVPEETMFADLASEVALVERHGDELQLREEVRGPALAALRLDDPELIQRVHERAAAFYAAQPRDDVAVVESVYHRLAKGDPPTGIDESVLRLVEPSTADLPEAAAAFVRRSLDPGGLRAFQDQVDWERRVLPQTDAALRSGRLDRARTLLGQRSTRSAGTELHRLESRLLEAEGDLDGAATAALRDLDAASVADDAVRYASGAVRLASLYERQGLPAQADRALEQAAGAAVLAGFPELRLELLLDRMTTRERAALDSDESRWVLGLEARVLLQRIGAQKVQANSALVRLLAAALGRDEPELLQDAVRRVGLGHEEDPTRVRALIGALADWDREQPEPGRLARMSGLLWIPTDPDPARRAWTAVAGLGTDAGLLLDRLWFVQEPPPPVREALRMIYLWWAVERASGPPAGEFAPLLLSQVPLDWARKETQELEELVSLAYPTGTYLRALADRAGVDLSRISWTGSGRRTTRELLSIAGRSGRLPALVEAVLADPVAVSVHDRLRALVGWTEPDTTPSE
jgi:hypothetical protein